MSAKGIGRTKLVSVIAIACLVVACLSLVACGGSSSSSAAASSSAASSASASSASASSASASASSSAASANSFVGSWTIAAAEQNGLTFGGNLGSFLQDSEFGTMTVNADGTGTFESGDGPVAFTWAAEGADMIYVTPQSATEFMAQVATPVTFKDDALFMPIEKDGEQATLILTADGNYAGAKQISMADATPITSESDLLGAWNLVGMNMAGISIYGDAQALAARGASATTTTFKEGGVVEMSSGQESTWAMGADGATITFQDISGTHTCPIMMLGDELAIDYSESLGGTEFIFVFAKA